MGCSPTVHFVSSCLRVEKSVGAAGTVAWIVGCASVQRLFLRCPRHYSPQRHEDTKMLLGWRAGAAEAGTVSRVVAYVFFAWSPVIHYRLPQRNSCRPLIPSACT